MTFWVYENWTVEAGGRVTVHRGECGHCNNGKGHERKNKVPGRNGCWCGPFANKNLAMRYAKSLDRGTPKECKCVG